MEKNIIEMLVSIGLTEGEAKTYTALSSLGTSTVGPIIEKSGISASKVYQILDKLMHKGFVQMILYEGDKTFTAADPEIIISYLEDEQKKIEQDKQKIKEIIPMLKMQQDSAEKKPIAEITIGKKGFESVYSEMIESSKNNIRYIGLGGSVMSFKLQSLWYPYSLKLQEKQIIHEVIYEDSLWYDKDPNIHRRKERKNFYPLLLPKKYKNLPNILVLGEKAIITGVDEDNEIFSLILRNKHLADVIYQMLDMIGDLAETPEGFKKLKN